MEGSFSSVVDVLVSDSALVGSAKKFGVKLKIPEARLEQLLITYVMGVTQPYDLMHGILKEWVEVKGNFATVPELKSILEENGWNLCSDKLSLIQKSTPGPILSPDASTSAKSKVDEIASISQSIPTIEPFGFGNVVTNFTGRDEEINTLSDYFHSDNCPFVLLTGLGGIGKTQLATKFSSDITSTVENDNCLTPRPRKTATTNSKIIKSWLAGENAQTLHKSLVKFHKHLGFPKYDGGNAPPKIEKLLKKIMKKLKATNDLYKWLVVIDNVDEEYDEFETVAKTFCSFGGKVFILVTSRNRDIFSGEVEVKHFPLPPLKLRNSVQFVKTSLEISSDSSDEFILELCEQLGNLPLALSQAVAYIKQQRTISLKGEKYSVEDYLGELRKQETVGLDKQSKLSEYQWSTMSVWNITFDKIGTAYGDRGLWALKLLDVLSFLDPDSIVMDSLDKIFVSFYNTAIGDSTWNVENCLELLLKYSLVSIRVEKYYSCVNIHRIVQLAIRERMNLENPSKEVELLTQFWTNFQTKCKIYGSPHNYMQIWKHSTNVHTLDRIRASVVHQLFDEIALIAIFYLLNYYHFAVEGCELLLGLFGEESLQYLTMQRRFMTRRAEISDSFLKKLVLLNDKLTVLVGETHMETLSTGNCISQVLHDLGRKEESIEWCHRLRHCFSRIIGQEDKSIIKIKEEVANRLGRMCNPKEALDMLEEILKWSKLNLDWKGDWDWNVLNVRTNIVKYLYVVGKCAEAKVKLVEFILLTETPRDVIWIKDQFADIMEDFGEFQFALDLMQEAAEECEKLEGGAESVLCFDPQRKVTRLRQKAAGHPLLNAWAWLREHFIQLFRILDA